MPRPKHIISAVDIGTSSIRAIMGALDDKGNIHVVGFAEKNSENSVIKGEIVNIEKVTDILFETIQAAENSSSESFDTANLYVAVTGNHIRGMQSRGTVAIHSPDRKVMPEDIEEASRIASSVSIPPEYMVLNSICGNYVLDDIRRTPHPEGQTANKLEAMSFTIIGNTNCVNSFLTPLREIGYEMPKPIFSGLASAISVLTEDEMKHGVALIDIGTGTTEYMVFHEACGCACGCIPVGCDHIANDIHIGLDLNISFARKLINDGECYTKKLEGVDFITIDGIIEKRKIPLNSIEKIIELRLTEIFDIVKKKLENEKILKCLHRGIVLTGGAALMPEIKTIANSQFDCLVRIGTPPNLYGAVSTLKSPKYCVLTGLVAAGEQIRRSNTVGGGGIIRRLDRFFQRIIKNAIRNAKDALPI